MRHARGRATSDHGARNRDGSHGGEQRHHAEPAGEGRFQPAIGIMTRGGTSCAWIAQAGGAGAVCGARAIKERVMRPESVGKWLALGGLVVLALSMTPTGEFIDTHEAWWSTRWKWMQCSLRRDQAAPAATINPILLYLGTLLSVGGLALAWRRDRGVSTGRAVQQRARPEEHTRKIYIGGLTYTTSRDELRQLFEAYGEVEHVHLL